MQIDPTLPETIWSDSHYFALVIEKLTTNAVKFTEQGYVRLHLEDKRTEDMSPQDGHIRLTIQDTGIGMSETDQSAIFNAFSQADTSKPRAYGGMGIGLFLVHKLANAMGSAVELSSEPGKGTVISFDLKWTEPQSEPAIPTPRCRRRNIRHDHS